LKIEVVPKGGQKDLLTICIDGDPWRDIHIAVYGRQPKFPECSSLDQWKHFFEENEYKRGKQYLLRRLSAQHYHSLLLSKLMIERLIDPKIVAKLIQECLSWGVMDDKMWIESYIRSQRKRHGLPMILAKLKMKGFSRDMLEQIQETFRDPESDKQAISKLLATKYRSKDLTQFPIKQKVIASLMRRGYSYDSIKSAFVEYEH
jgi:regulatory protein